MTGQTKKLKGIVLVAASALIWSSGGLIVRSIRDADSWTIVFWRSLTAAAFLLALIIWERRGRSWAAIAGMGWPGLVVAASFACASISLVVALRLTSVADVLIIMSAAPMIAAILGRVFLHERVSGLTILTIIATFAGIALIVGKGLASWRAESLLGDAFAFMIAISYSVAIVVTRHNSHVPMTPAVFTGVVIACLVAIPFATPWSISLHDAPLLVSFGAFQLGLGLAAFTAGARLIPAAHTALLGTLEPVLGPLWVWLFVSETPSLAALAGGVLVLASITLHTLAEMWNSNSANRPRP